MRETTDAPFSSQDLANWLCNGRPSFQAAPSRGWISAFLLILVLLGMPFSAKGAVTEFVVPKGPEITFQDGRSIDGHIIRMDQRDLVIQVNDGRTQTVPRSTVERVAFETVNGERIAGELVGWTPGIYQIATPSAAIKIYSAMPAIAQDKQPIARRLIVPETDSESDEVRLSPALALASEPLDSGRGSPQAIAALKVQPTTSEDNVAEPDDLAALPDAAATPKASLSIQVVVEHSKENGQPVAFNIELSEPSEDPVVLIYATIDGTAIRGEDYEPNRGVVMIQPGERTARIEAPVIDDTEEEGQEHLKLFLTVDPTVAVVETRQIIANIDDDDQG